jgi:hypothetical protein
MSFKHLPRFPKWRNALAGQVRMDLEPGRTRVHEHAETGKRFYPSDEDRSPEAP